MILRRSTEKLSDHHRDERIALRGADHRERDAGVAGRRLDHRLAGLQRAAALGVLDDGDREAVLDRGQRVEDLALHVHRDARRREAVDADDRRAADGAENAVVDHALPFEKSAFTRLIGEERRICQLYEGACLRRSSRPSPSGSGHGPHDRPDDAPTPDDAGGLLPHRQRRRRDRSASIASCSSRCAWPGNPARPIDDTNLGKYLFEVIDRASNRVVYSRGFASVFGEWETTGRGEGRCAGRSPSRCASRRPTAPVQIVPEEARRAERLPRGLDAARRSRRTCSSTRPLPASPGPLIEIQKNGDAGAEGRLPDPGRRLHGRRARASSRRTRGAWRSFSSPSSRSRARRGDFNVWAPLPSVRASRASRARRRASIAARGSAPRTTRSARERYILTFDNRSLRDVASFAPYEFVEILTNARTYGGGGIFGLTAPWPPTASGRPTSSSTSSATTSPRSPTSTTPRPSPTSRPRPRASSRGSRTSRRCSIRRTLKWKDLVDAGHAPADALEEGRVREGLAGEYQAKRREIRAANGPEDEMDALFQRGAGLRDEAARRPTSTPGRSARSKARCTRPRATTGRRTTASCSPATKSRSAPSAGGPSRRVIDLYSR